MDYQKIYEAIVHRAQGRKKLKKGSLNYVYYERHHVIPRCIGGSDDPSNLVYLTAEEHWVAHLLLVKINPGIDSLVRACQAMSMAGRNRMRTNNKMFGWIRRKYSEAVSAKHKGRKLSDEHKQKLSKSLKGRPVPNQVGEKNVAKRPEVAQKISNANKGRKLGPRSADVKEKISRANKGRYRLSGELHPHFKGWIIATCLETGLTIKMASREDIKNNGFDPTRVYECLRGVRSSHKNFLFKRENLSKTIEIPDVNVVQ